MHIEEIDNIQNLNLGWFAIEQADELDSDHEFFFLLGRLRRSLAMTQEFQATGLPIRGGFVIGNAGDHWGKKLWKENPDEEFPCIEANTMAMQDILPKDYYEGLEIIHSKRPAIYQQYVMNRWDITNDAYAVIYAGSLNKLKSINIRFEKVKRIIACDPSLGGDECVIYVIENGRIEHQEIMHEGEADKIAIKIAELGEEFDVFDFVVDGFGPTAEVLVHLTKLVSKYGKAVIPVNSAEVASEKDLYFNKRTEMWFYLSNLIYDKKIPFPEDEELRRQLLGARYEPVMRKGRVKLEDKQKTKKRLNCSPDRADAFVYGIYHLQFVNENRYKATPKDNYKRFDTNHSEATDNLVRY